jgi:phosphoglycolate phosphatase
MAVVSNKPDAAVRPLCADYFPGLYARGESVDCPRKPAPDMVFKAMEAIGVTRCIYVGDSEVDVLTAQKAGMPCLSVLWGFRNREEIEAAGGSNFCEKPAQLVEKLEEMINGK